MCWVLMKQYESYKIWSSFSNWHHCLPQKEEQQWDCSDLRGVNSRKMKAEKNLNSDSNIQASQNEKKIKGK